MGLRIATKIMPQKSQHKSKGTLMAEETRAIANQLTDAQREKYLAKAMQRIYRGRAEKVSAHRR